MEDIELDKRRTYGTHSTSHISHGVGPDARHRGLRGVVDDDPETEEQQMSYYYSHFHFRQPFFVNVVIILCLITFLYSLYLGGFVLAPFDLNPTLGVSFDVLLLAGAKQTDLILAGQWWRLFAPLFLHAGALHLFCNILALYQIGVPLEQCHGWAPVAFIFLVSGVFGNLCSAIFSPNDLTVGASGAVMGLFGALWIEICRYGHLSLMFGMLLNALLIVSMGFLPFVDNFAHVGSLLIGALLGAAVFPSGTAVIILDDDDDFVLAKSHSHSLQSQHLPSQAAYTNEDEGGTGDRHDDRNHVRDGHTHVDEYEHEHEHEHEHECINDNNDEAADVNREETVYASSYQNDLAFVHENTHISDSIDSMRKRKPNSPNVDTNAHHHNQSHNHSHDRNHNRAEYCNDENHNILRDNADINEFDPDFVLSLQQQQQEMHPILHHHQSLHASCITRSCVCRTICFSFAMVLMVSAIYVLLTGLDPNKYCSWCHYISCVPSSYWTCDSDKT